jgi:post-segregation antitoxin (ccd killing protein)
LVVTIGGKLSKYTTLSVKVPKEVKEKLKKHGIRPSEILKKAILDEIREREIEELERRADEMKDELAKFSTEYVVKAIREDRDSR